MRWGESRCRARVQGARSVPTGELEDLSLRLGSSLIESLEMSSQDFGSILIIIVARARAGEASSLGLLMKTFEGSFSLANFTSEIVP